jgi:AcrR family transcriptional regulator
VFVERGFAAAKLADVARKAGVSKGTVYLYFDSKEALLKAVVRDTIVPALGRGEATVRDFVGSSEELLRRLVHAWWDTIGHSQVSGIPKLMMAEAANFPELARFYYDEVIKRGHSLLASVLQRGITSREFRPLPDLRLAVRLLIAPVLQLATWKHSFGVCVREPIDPTAYLDTHLDLFLHGIRHD